MAILTGVIRFIGSIKGIRNFKKLHDSKIYASEKGSLGPNIYKKSPEFVNNRLSNDEFGGCAKAVRNMRIGFTHLIPEMVDSQFNERLMHFTRALSLKDVNGILGRRSLRFSEYRSWMQTLYFNKKRKVIESAKIYLKSVHSESRMETTLEVNGLIVDLKDSPSSVDHYRLLSHLSIVSDYHCPENSKRYEPINPINGLSAFAYSELATPGVAFTTQIKVSFPEGTVISDNCTVIHCAAIEFFQSNGSSGYRPIYGPSLGMMDVF